MGRAFHRTRRGQVQQITCGRPVRYAFQISKDDFRYESLRGVSTSHWAGARAGRVPAPGRPLGSTWHSARCRSSAIRKSLLDDQSCA